MDEGRSFSPSGVSGEAALRRGVKEVELRLRLLLGLPVDFTVGAVRDGFERRTVWSEEGEEVLGSGRWGWGGLVRWSGCDIVFLGSI